MFFKVYSLSIVLLFIIGCTPPVIEEDFQDSYTVAPTLGKIGSISFTFAGKAVAVDNYAVYYSETPLDDPLTAPPTDVTLNTYATDESLKLQINKLKEGRIYYVWVYAKRGAEIIASLPMQTVYAYTDVKNYRLKNNGGDVQATWLAVNGAKRYSIFKDEDANSSLLVGDIADTGLLLENKLNDQDSSYIMAYDDDGDMLGRSSSAIYDPGISLSLNAEAGIFPGTIKLRWEEDTGAVLYDLISSEVDNTDKVIPGTEKIININPSVDGVLGVDPLDSRVRTVAYLVQNLPNGRFSYKIKGKDSDGSDSQSSGLVIVEPRQDLTLEPFTTFQNAVAYEMGINWNKEHSTERDLNGKSLEDLYSGLKYELIFTRPMDAPAGLGGSKFVYSDPSNNLSYTNSTYSVAVNDSANLSVYNRNVFKGTTVGNYTVELKLVGRNRTTLVDNIVLGSYKNTVVPNPIESYALDSQFDGVDKVTLSTPTATSNLKNYYRVQENVGYDDIPLLTDLELLPDTGTLDFSSPSLSSLKGARVIQFEVWTALDGVYVSFGAGSTNITPQTDLVLSAIPGRLPGSIYVSWNASYTRDTSGYVLEVKRTGTTNWTKIADISSTSTEYIIYDLDLIDEVAGNIPMSYDVRLTPNTVVDDQVITYSKFPKGKLVLETPTQLSHAADYTPFEVRMSEKYISATGVSAISDIEARDRTQFNAHFTGSLAPKIRLTITRPSLKPSGVAATIVEEYPFNYSSINKTFNDADNASYVSVRAGRAYAGDYSAKYQLVGQNKDGGEQILAESAELFNIQGGYLNPRYIGSKSGSDDLTISSDADAKYRPRKFTKKRGNSANYQLIYFTSATSHDVVPTQPENGTLNTSNQIYKLGDGFPDFAEDLRKKEYSGVYYIQVYTYRTSDDLLIGSKLMEFNSSFVLQPMFWYVWSLNLGGTPFVHWFMPYLRDMSGTGDVYYFYNGWDVTTVEGGVGFVPLSWFAGFTIYTGFNDERTSNTEYTESFLVSYGSSQYFAMAEFFKAYNDGQSRFYDYPSMYFFDAATGARFGRGIGYTKIFGHYISYEGSKPAGYDSWYGANPGP